MPEYLVERYWPGVTDAEVRDVVARLNRATAAQRAIAAQEVAAVQTKPGTAAAVQTKAGTAAAAETGASNAAVSYLGSTLMLNDELVCCRFDAENAQDVADLNDVAGLRYDRILRVHSFPRP